MKRPQDLFDLIKSLTPAEKGYFKKYVTKGEGKKYLKLFDAINAMEEYDEEKLKKKFKKELSNLSAAKNYLFEEVVDATRAFQLNNSYTTQILRLTDQADLLFKRGIYNTAREKYAAAYEIAVSIFSYKYAIVPRWGFIQSCLHLSPLDPILPAKATIALNNKIMDETWLDFANLEYLIMKTNYRFNIGNPQTKAMLNEMRAEEIAHINLIAERTGDSVLGNVYRHWRDSFYAYETNNRLLMLTNSLAAIKLFRANEELKKADSDTYFILLINLMMSYFGMNMHKESRFLLGFIKKEAAHFKAYMFDTTSNLVQVRLYMLAIKMHMRFHTQQETHTLFKEILAWLKPQEIQRQDAGIIMLSYMEHLFSKGDYRELAFRCNEFLYSKSIAYPQQQRACALLIYLTTYLEQGDWDILPAKLKESYRLLKEENTTNEGALLVIRLVGKVIKEKKEFQLKPTLLKLKEEMSQRAINETGFTEVFSPFNFESWIDCKLKGIKYSEAVKRNFALKTKKVTEQLEQDLIKESLTLEDLKLPIAMRGLRDMIPG